MYTYTYISTCTHTFFDVCVFLDTYIYTYSYMYAYTYTFFDACMFLDCEFMCACAGYRCGALWNRPASSPEPTSRPSVMTPSWRRANSDRVTSRSTRTVSLAARILRRSLRRGAMRLLRRRWFTLHSWPSSHMPGTSGVTCSCPGTSSVEVFLTVCW